MNVAAVRLRRIDARAKRTGLPTPSLEDFRGLIEASLPFNERADQSPDAAD